MREKTKRIIKDFVPPIFLSWIKPTPKKYGYFGNYKSWDEVEKISTGYSSDVIIEKVRSASLKVKNGEAVYERDSVLFNEIEVSWPLLAGLLMVALQNNNELEVVDFGGSLGTSYYQNRGFLKHLKRLKWNIVEQDKFVEIGKREFADQILDFYHDKNLKELVENNSSNVLIVSSSLQFLKNPHEFVRNVSQIQYIIFDKIPFFTKHDSNDHLMLQKVSPKIYDTHYPVWIFGYNDFIREMGKKYELISSFDSYDKYKEMTENGEICYKGFIFKIK